MAKTFEGKSRLVCLAYQVLSKIDVVVSGKTDGELMAVLIAAFQLRAAEVADAELSHGHGPRCKPPLPEALTHPILEWRHDRDRQGGQPPRQSLSDDLAIAYGGSSAFRS